MSHKNTKYLQWVRQQPCIHCGHPEAEPHHIIGIGMGAMALKASDIHTMPLCRRCHDQVHEHHDDGHEVALDQVRWLIRTQDKAQSEGML